MQRAAMLQERDGGPAKDLSAYTAWRDEAHPENLAAISIYAGFLVGQTSGLSNALDLGAARTACELAGVPPEDQAETVERLVLIHRELLEHHRREE